MKKKLYLAVIVERYELPIGVFDTSRELADWSGYSIGYVLSSIAHNYPRKKTGMKFVRVEVDWEEIDDGKSRN